MYNNPILDIEAANEVPEVGLGAGLRVLTGINDQFYFRTGAAVVQKNFGIEVQRNGFLGTLDLSYIYLEVPLTLYRKASHRFGFFGGSAVNALLSNECFISGDFQTCHIEDNEFIVLSAILGIEYSLSASSGVEISYEYGLTETAKDIRVNSAIATFLYHFN